MKIAGWEIKRSKEDEDEEKGVKLQSFSEPVDDDGSIVVDSGPSSIMGNAYGIAIDLDGSAKSETELVYRYRQMAQHPECRRAIDDIINEVVVVNDFTPTVKIDCDGIPFTDSVKKKISEEFENVLKLLDFDNKAYDIVHKWFVDGRTYYQVVIDDKNTKEGIKELRYLDATKTRKVKEIETKMEGEIPVRRVKSEFYAYSESGFGAIKRDPNRQQMMVDNIIRIAKDGVVHVTSGVVNENNTQVLSHLHKAIKPLNQLRILEDSVVIYRVSRAPERLVFYIDVGNLPKTKAEQYMTQMMTNYKNKLVYNSTTGEISDDRRHMSMLDNFWLARREGGKGTEITTLPGGQNLGDIEDILYFQKKLYYALDVPISRMQSEQLFNVGRTSEITRDEIKFSKFVQRLRNRFSILFDEVLKRQLILKNIISPDDWDVIRNDIKYIFAEDNHFEELKKIEVFRERSTVLNEIDQFVGVYFSRNWVRKNILKFSDEEIEKMKEEMDKEKEEEPDVAFGADDDGGEFPPEPRQPPGMAPPRVDGKPPAPPAPPVVEKEPKTKKPNDFSKPTK